MSSSVSAFARNGLRRDMPRPAQVGFRIEDQIRSGNGDPADRQMPERTTEIRATNVFWLIGPEISGGDVARDGMTAQAEVGDEPPARQRQPHHGIHPESAHDGHETLRSA